MERLRELRLNNGYSHKDMAEQLAISKTYYWQLEHDRRRLSYDMAIKIANIFHATPDELFYQEFQTKKQGN